MLKVVQVVQAAVLPQTPSKCFKTLLTSQDFFQTFWRQALPLRALCGYTEAAVSIVC